MKLVRKYRQNVVLKVYIVITSKIFADFRFESPISIDFQNEILALLPPKSANTFAPSKVCTDFQSESPSQNSNVL